MVDTTNAIEAHGEALFTLSAVMLKRKLFPEKGNELTEAYEAVVSSWAALADALIAKAENRHGPNPKEPTT